ncbi:MAG: beta-glucanase (GH16 family) [Paraglaciecola sp.]|jgi:beta-glucanase (GH16 family)
MKSKLLIVGLLGAMLFWTACGKDDTGGNGDDGAQPNAPTLSISDLTKFEGDENSTFDFKVRLSRASEEVVTVDFKTENAAAIMDEDFIAQNGTLTFEPNDLEKIIAIEIVADTLKEGDEDFRVTLSNPVNAGFSKATGTGTMRNDDTFLVTDGQGYSTPLSYAGMTLVWQDEFEGSTIDLECWNHELGNSGWGNNELQNYTASSANSYISDGKLVIEVKEESSGGSNYSSARMTTRGKKEFALGRIDLRARLPKGQGIWPALWSLGANFETVGWPACGEMDIMELVGHEPEKVHGTAHWGPQGQSFSNYQTGTYDGLPEGEDFGDEFHVFTLIWETNSMNFLVDDVSYHLITASEVNGAYPFNAPFFFIFNVAVGGNWPGNPDATTVFPQRMFVDYIRVFQ